MLRELQQIYVVKMQLITEKFYVKVDVRIIQYMMKINVKKN